MSIEYRSTNEEVLDEIKELLTQLNQHHIGKSVYFKRHYEEMTFEVWKKQLIDNAKRESLRLDLALDKISGRNIGYCVSSVSADNVGEI